MENDQFSSLMESNWRRMETMLNKELPVRKQKRNYLFLFWILTGFFLFMISAYYVLKLSSYSDTKTYVDQKGFVKSKQTNNHYTAWLNCDTLTHKDMVPNSEISHIIIIEPKADKYDKTRLSNKNEPKIFFGNRQSHDFNIEKERQMVEIESGQNMNLTTPSRSKGKSNVTLAEQLSKKYIFISRDNQMYKIDKSPIPLAMNDNTQKWQLGVKSNVMFNTFNAPNQYFAGIYSQRLLSQRVYLEGHLGLKIFDKYTKFLQTENTPLSDANDVQESIIPGSNNIFGLDSKTLKTNEINTINESIITSTLNSAAYMDANLSLYYKLNNRLAVGAGITTLRFLYSSFTPDESSAKIYHAFNNTLLDKNKLVLANDLIKKWLFNYNFDLNFNINNTLVVYSSVTYGNLANRNVYAESLDITANPSNAGVSLSNSDLKRPENGHINVGFGIKYRLK